MTTKAKATFKNVNSNHSIYDQPDAGPSLSRIAHEREFQGDLEGQSTAEIQACMVSDERFGYVGTDRFSGRLGDRQGTFVFQHGGIRDKGELRPFGFVVSGSGTEKLAGIYGDVTITVTSDGEHRIEINYDFER